MRSPTAAVVVVALAIGILTAACSPIAPTATSTPGSQGPTASPRDPLEVYAEIATAVEGIRGLQPTGSITPVLIDAPTLRANLTAAYAASNPPAALTAREGVLRSLGLLAPGVSLRQANLDLLAGQVAGYYSPEKDQLFVVSRSGGVGVTQEATYAHEFTHQLQDQHFDLSKLGLDSPGNGDRALARLALVEGDASAAQAQWMATSLSPAELAGLMLAASDPVAMKALQDAPAFLRDTSFFPYQDGLSFVGTLIAGSGRFDAVNAAFADPPASTEQVLHPDKYATREAPVQVSLPAGLASRLGAGWSLAAEDTLGELMLRIWIRESGDPQGPALATSAAAGWGGDRVGLLAGPGDARALVVVSEWDTAQDAAEFASAAPATLGSYGLDGDVLHRDGSTRVVLVMSPDGPVRAALRGAFGD